MGEMQTLDTQTGRGAEIAIEVDSVSKCFRIASESVGRVSSFFVNRMVASKKMVDLWALKDVSFDVRRGEVLGILGTNGSGKSTLLRILNGITTPTRGSVTAKGRIAALLDLSAGFHPTLTGYENLFLSGSILGLSRDEVRALLPEIKLFSGISHEYLDSPVRYYSTGMIARLGFALSVSCNPEIVLIDEVMAVGDSEFQARSARRLLDFRTEGKAMILVSHVPSVVLDLATRVLWLHKGEVHAYGETAQVVKEYETYLNSRIARGERELEREHQEAESNAPSFCVFSNLELQDASGAPTVTFRTGGKMLVRIRLELSHTAPDDAEAMVRVAHETGTVMDEATFAERGVTLPQPLRGRWDLELVFDPLLLSRGNFTITVLLVSKAKEKHVYCASVPAAFSVQSNYVDYPQHLVELPCEVLRL
jgi:ABC-type polysaccharide/polyol phosphate transport system ATPase subunit